MLGLLISCKDENSIFTFLKSTPKFTPRDTLIELVDQYIRQRLDSCHCPGAAITIITDTSTRLLKGYGKRSLLDGEKVDSFTVFRLASVSKNFGGLLMTLMMQRGIIHANDPVQKYIPEFGVKQDQYSSQITINHILSHSSSLPYHSYTNLVESGMPLDQIIPFFKEINLQSPPGTEYAYQNASFALLEKILHKVTGIPFDSLLAETFCKPLGMHQLSCTYNSLIQNADHASPHNYQQICSCYVADQINDKYYNTISAGGINASITDMNKWLHMLMGNRPDIMPGAVLDTFFLPRILTSQDRRYYNYWPNVKDTYYAYGMRILDRGDHSVYYHGGFANNYRSEIAIDTSHKIGIVALFNSTCCLADEIVPAVINMMSK
jgi:beta-lactamase class C